MLLRHMGIFRASNIIVQGDRSRCLDLSVPHIRIMKQYLKSSQELERKDLEIGIALLSTVRLDACTSLVKYMKLTELATYKSKESMLPIYHSSAHLLSVKPSQNMILQSTFSSLLRLYIGSRLAAQYH